MVTGKSEGAAPEDPAFPSISTGQFDDLPEPPMPVVDSSNEARASTQYSRYRTRLSTHRTGLSEFRTGLSTNRTEMSMRRTGMSFQRTRLSADRTLMSVIRTSLSMISFGFTIYSFFRGMKSSGSIAHGDMAATFFGQALVFLGIGILALGIVYHVLFMSGLRQQRGSMKSAELIHAESKFPLSVTLATAILLLLLGAFAALGMILRVGPFGG
jgi:uncharacterized membrane protein YidH (DUF202 family)